MDTDLLSLKIVQYSTNTEIIYRFFSSKKLNKTSVEGC